MSIWFPYLLTDRVVRAKPKLKQTAFVLIAPIRGRMVVQAANYAAIAKGIIVGMVVADARAILPTLKVLDYNEDMTGKILKGLAEWMLRYTPVVAVDSPDGVILDISGCAHLWGGEQTYITEIIRILHQMGYTAKAAIADTIGTSWAVARYGKQAIIEPGQQLQALQHLPSACLRLEPPVLEKMNKLGFYQAGIFITLSTKVLRRRFGTDTIKRIGQALGEIPEYINSIQPATVFQSRLPCLEPIRTRTAIDIALKKLLEDLSAQLCQHAKGLRKARFKIYRIDHKSQQIEIGTNRPVRNVAHLLELFAEKVAVLQPGPGIEIFSMEACIVETLSTQQESFWASITHGKANVELSHLMDRIAAKVGAPAIYRYLPVEQYWPEQSVKIAATIFDQPDANWRTDRLRPILLLKEPEPIEVTVPIPDYPPMLFIYKKVIHKIKKADGPERMERAWWQDKRKTIRDYYRVEDESGARYWLFRSGTYDDNNPRWFIHGFFA